MAKTEHEKELDRERTRRWRTSHPEREVAKNRKYRETNKEKRRAANKKWRAENPEYKKKQEIYREKNKDKIQARQALYRDSGARRAYSLKKLYKLTLEEFTMMTENQGGKCLICLLPPKGNLHVDHDHKTGKIRGLLCNTCNRGIGYLKDSRELCLRASEYLNG